LCALFGTLTACSILNNPIFGRCPSTAGLEVPQLSQ
jgi:hypothetical protein